MPKQEPVQAAEPFTEFWAEGTGASLRASSSKRVMWGIVLSGRRYWSWFRNWVLSGSGRGINQSIRRINCRISDGEYPSSLSFTVSSKRQSKSFLGFSMPNYRKIPVRDDGSQLRRAPCHRFLPGCAKWRLARVSRVKLQGMRQPSGTGPDSLRRQEFRSTVGHGPGRFLLIRGE